MKRSRRGLPEASLSFLDVISCGFGAIVLLLIIAPLGDPAPLDTLQATVVESVRDMQQKLFTIRGESSRMSAQLKSRQEQLSELKDRVARLQEKLSSAQTQSSEVAMSESSEEKKLRLAMQVLSEEMQRLQVASPVQNQLIGGVPVDSEYIIFVIDTSGSMQSSAWQKLQREMINILDIYPKVKGIQVLNDEGQYMFPAYSGRWVEDSPEMRKKIISTLANWAPYSDSSPVEGIEDAIKIFYKRGQKISIYTLGDDFQGRSIRAVVKAVDALNRAHRGADRLVRIHAIGFPVHFPEGGMPTASAVRFAALMRELSYNNGGTFIGLNSNH